jgi:hypothetical protein
MERLVLTAQVALEDSGYVARLAQLSLEGTGESVQEAQDQLIQAMRSWIETHDGQDDLAQVLAQAGFPGVEEDTELQLEFGE